MPVASAAPTCTSSAASSPNPSSHWSSATRSSVRCWSLAAASPASAPGQRVGVPWLGWTCGRCRFCASGRENLCDRARFTGYTIDGGFAEETLADARSWFMVPEGYPDLQAAPLLCAGLIGYRSLRLTGDATLLGIYGFGAAVHSICQVARWQGRRVFAFTRPGGQPGPSLRPLPRR